METIVGIFTSRKAAESAARSLESLAFTHRQVQLLLPERVGDDVSFLPTDDTEQPGVAPALGAVVGAAAGGAVGLGIGAAVATLLLPGIGPVTAIGLAAAGLFGAGGAAGGAAAGRKLEEATTHGLPRDEVYLYEDALAHGHSIVFVMAEDDERAEAARTALSENGAESLDAARERWWVGLRDVEKEHYEETTPGFDEVEAAYRAGFTAGLHPDLSDESAEEALRRRPEFGRGQDAKAFRHGFERGFAQRRSAAGAPTAAR